MWILISALYMAAIITVLVIELPGTKDIPHKFKYFALMERSSKKLLLEAEDSENKITVTMPNGYKMSFPHNISKERKANILKEYDEIIKEQVNKRRWENISIASFVWFIPCLVLYMLGWSIGWVRRGFKQN